MRGGVGLFALYLVAIVKQAAASAASEGAPHQTITEEDDSEDVALLQSRGVALEERAPPGNLTVLVDLRGLLGGSRQGRGIARDSRRRRRAMIVGWDGVTIGPSPLLKRLDEMRLARARGAPEAGMAPDEVAAALPPSLFQVGSVTSEGAEELPGRVPEAAAAPAPAQVAAPADAGVPGSAPAPEAKGTIGDVSAEQLTWIVDQTLSEVAEREARRAPARGKATAELGAALSNATAAIEGKVAELVRQTANATVTVNLTAIAAPPQPGKEVPVVVVELSKVKVFLGLLVVVAAVYLLVSVAVSLSLQAVSSQEDELGQEVEKIRLTRGAELQSMFAMASPSDPLTGQPLSPGILTRVQGRVVAGPEGSLRAPFSGRECALYSASVSRARHDGIQPPPLAFHSASCDFEIQLTDPTRLSLGVRGHDVALFGMAGGLEVHALPFAGAPESWRRFVLDRLVPATSASTHFESCSDLSAVGGPLQFRECAALIGSEVTCIGEVVREQGGRLRLQPWRPPPPAQGSAPGRLALSGRVMASDGPGLLRSAAVVPGLRGGGAAALRRSPSDGEASLWRCFSRKGGPSALTPSWQSRASKALWQLPGWLCARVAQKLKGDAAPAPEGFPVPDAPRTG